jgi:N-acylneuraminate cytidylyltransferase
VSGQVLGFVFARGGSKGVPRKNVRLLGGIPLVGHAVRAGLASKHIRRVIVSTDDTEIAGAARANGGETPFVRPPELCTDTAPEWLAWQHALRFVQEHEGQDAVRAFVSLPPTSPLRAPEDVDACVELLLSTGADVVLSVTPSARNPFFNMVQFDAEGAVRLVATIGGEVHGRQAAPKVFDITTVAYAARPEFVLRAKSLWDGKVRAVMVPAERAVDVDTELDLLWAEFLWQRRQAAT